MPEHNGMMVAIWEGPRAEGDTLRNVTRQYQQTYVGNGLTDEAADAATAAANAPCDMDAVLASDAVVYLTPEVSQPLG